MNFEPTKEEIRAAMARAKAASLGCGLCQGAIRPRPAGDPFSKGPYIGRYWCVDCWTLYWDEHPDHLADEESRVYVREEAKRIRLRRGSKLVHEEGSDRVYMTSKGTLVFDFRTSGGLAPNEYDPARLEVLKKVLKAIEKPVEEKSPVSAT